MSVKATKATAHYFGLGEFLGFPRQSSVPLLLIVTDVWILCRLCTTALILSRLIPCRSGLSCCMPCSRSVWVIKWQHPRKWGIHLQRHANLLQTGLTVFFFSVLFLLVICRRLAIRNLLYYTLWVTIIIIYSDGDLHQRPPPLVWAIYTFVKISVL